MREYDAVVVGSGVAGMSAAVILAREGQKVLVVEQARKPGGLMQVFRRGGHAFPTGVHILGSLRQGQALWRYFKYLGILDRIRLVPQDGDNFLRIDFPGTRFLMPGGREAFREKLIDTFPDERRGIDDFLGVVASSVARFSLYNLKRAAEMIPAEMERASLGEYLDRTVRSEELKSILTSINPFYGVAPHECPVHVHALVLDSFLQGACRIDESELTLVEAFQERIAGLGGEVRCGARVTEVQTDAGRVTGVALAGGESVEAGRVVFTAHPKSLPGMCRDTALRPAYRERILGMPETPGCFGAAIVCRGSMRSLECHNAFLYRGKDMSGHYGRKSILAGEAPYQVFTSASPGGEGVYSLVALSSCDLEEWSRWSDSRTGRRPADYYLAKESLGRGIADTVKAQWDEPGVEMEVVATFSPLTFRDYTLTPTGSAYGIKKSIGSARRVTALTRVKGLYLAGQNVVLPGVLGTVISALDACGEIVGHEYLLNKIAGETE